MKQVYLQGNLLPEADATLPIANRALRFGDGVFETMRVENSRIYNFTFHEKRLQKGLKAIKLPVEIDLADISIKLIKANNLKAGFIRVSIGRSSGSAGYLPTSNEATIIGETIEGFSEQPETAKLHYSSYPAQNYIPAKTMNGLNYTLALMQAQENGFDNALLLDTNGHVCETASGNIFWVKERKLYTPADHLPLIPGSIRERIIKLHGAVECVSGLEDVKNADEVFMTNVNCLVLPFTERKDKALQIKQLIKDDIKSS